MDNVILVNDRDEEIGVADKMEAHREGRLHRAFSVLIVNSAGEWLLQRRAADKYHSGGLWSNTCCSHPRPGESVLDAAGRRLREEMGFESELTRLFGFVYRVNFPSGLVEHEYDHVLWGQYEGAPEPDENEVSAWRWLHPDKLLGELRQNPETFTYWFRVILQRMREGVSHLVPMSA